jgi:hypothetical protein
MSESEHLLLKNLMNREQAFFFEKKKQKTFECYGFGLS